MGGVGRTRSGDGISARNASVPSATEAQSARSLECAGTWSPPRGAHDAAAVGPEGGAGDDPAAPPPRGRPRARRRRHVGQRTADDGVPRGCGPVGGHAGLARGGPPVDHRRRCAQRARRVDPRARRRPRPPPRRVRRADAAPRRRRRRARHRLLVALLPPPGPADVRLLGLLVLFAGAMVGLVLADDLLVLYAFWELTSITSFLLIGNKHTDATRTRRRAAGAPRDRAGRAGDARRIHRPRPGRRHVPAVGDPRRPAERHRRRRGHRAGPPRCVHEVRAGAVPRLAAGRDGRRHAGQHVPPLGDDGQGRRLPDRQARPGLRRPRPVAPGRRGRRRVDDDRRRPAGAPPARPQAAAGVRDDQPARLHGRRLRLGHVGGDGRRQRAAPRPRRVQGRRVHGRRDPRPPARHP